MPPLGSLQRSSRLKHGWMGEWVGGWVGGGWVMGEWRNGLTHKRWADEQIGRWMVEAIGSAGGLSDRPHVSLLPGFSKFSSVLRVTKYGTVSSLVKPHSW